MCAAQTTGTIEGGCLCGAVRYASRGTPRVSLICHCRDCQRASGSGHVPVLVVPADGFTFTGLVTPHASPGGSGAAAVRNTCAACGSLCFGTPAIAPDIVTIYAGTLDDPSLFRPAYAQFVRDRAPWDTSLGLREFAAAPPS